MSRQAPSGPSGKGLPPTPAMKARARTHLTALGRGAVLRIPVRGFAIATLHAYAEEGVMTADDRADEDMADVLAVVDAYAEGASYATGTTCYLVFPLSVAESVRRGLIELANGEDDQADALRRRDPEGAGYCRAACRGLSTLARMVAEKARDARCRP